MERLFDRGDFMNTSFRVALTMGLWMAFSFPLMPAPTDPLFAQEQDLEEKEFAWLVPQNLLKLIHAPEVHAEIGLEPEDPRLLKTLEALDGPWWTSRNLPVDKQRQAVAELERQLLESLKTWMTSEQFKRLREIEVQSQGTRALLRKGIGKSIGLTNVQRQAMVESFRHTDELERSISQTKDKTAAKEDEWIQARQAEHQKFSELISASQRMEIGKLIGKPFDTSKLKRIYPKAPELIDSGKWVTNNRTSLIEQRGNVVLLHFYAFQCHNCIANFHHYKRWHQTLSNKGVMVIGIQTPETEAEKDVEQVRRAAKERGFEFPVVIDSDRKNWNAWGNTMWPTVYVIDQNGYIRSWWQGELNWQGAKGDEKIESLVDELLAEDLGK